MTNTLQDLYLLKPDGSSTFKLIQDGTNMITVSNMDGNFGWCGNKNGLENLGPTGSVEHNPEFYFERVVIGMP